MWSTLFNVSMYIYMYIVFFVYISRLFPFLFLSSQFYLLIKCIIHLGAICTIIMHAHTCYTVIIYT